MASKGGAIVKGRPWVPRFPHRFQDLDLVKQLTSANSGFALDAYRHMTIDSSNVFFSPMSISTALALTYLGARGNTANEMAKVLKFDQIKGNVHEAFNDFIKAVQSPAESSGYILTTANKLFARKDYKFLDEYLEKSLKLYSAEAQNMDFVGDGEGSRQAINQWVEEQTANKIPDLLPSGFINDLTVMVLVNAIYFKGSWTHPFEKSNTMKGKFYKGNGGESIDVDMMNFQSMNQLRAGIQQDLDCKVVELPYGNQEVSMILLVPNERNGLEDLEKKLTPELLENAVTRIHSNFHITLQLPKFKLEEQVTLNTILQALGMKDVFSEGAADLSGLDGSRNLHVSQVIHKAFVDVNEEGTEAAAATAVGIMLASMPMPLEVICDRPFMFIIRERASGAILFMGRLVAPTSS